MSHSIDVNAQQTALPELMHPGSRMLFRYWERIRGERSAPDRADVDLRAIGSVLASVGILERHRRPTVFLWRVAGTGIGDIWGKEVTGHDMLAGWKGMERHSLVSCLDAVVDAHQPFVARFSASSDHGEAVGVELVALPVRPAERETQILCTALAFRDPAWLSTRAPRSLSLTSIRIIWTEPLPGDPVAAQRPDAAHIRPAVAPLRVIRGGKDS
ncbi:MAG: PAS domain-containing protein [Parvibaculaceae bacterium]